MNPSALRDLSALTEMLYRAEQARMRDLNETESRLRRALGSLDETRKTALALPADTLGPMRRVGGDILWQGWIGRNRAELNRQLALCLAQKARLMARLRRAHGKHEAARHLLKDADAATRGLAARREITELDALILARSDRPARR